MRRSAPYPQHSAVPCLALRSAGLSGAAAQAHRGLLRALLPAAVASCGGVALFSSLFLSLPLSSEHLARMQQLNRALGKLCTDPPREALTVCRLHAGLVRAF